MEKFLIINPFGIGDVIFTTPVIGALKEKYPDSFIGYWCNERVAGLLKEDKRISRVFALSRGDIKRVYKGFKRVTKLISLIGEIRAQKFGTALDFSLDSRYGLWSILAGIKKRVGFNYNGRGRFLSHKIGLASYSDKHIVEYYFDLLKFIGIESNNRSLKLFADEDVKRCSGPGLKIGIAMGGGQSWGKYAVYKQWPPDKFGKLARMIADKKEARLVLLGSSDEKELAEAVKREANGGNIEDLTGKLDLESLARAIKGLKLLICNDGGPLHMAAALGVSTVSIFGPVDDKVYGPYPASEKHIVVKKEDVYCRPCYKNFRFKGCPNNKRCLEEITVDEVYGKVKELI